MEEKVTGKIHGLKLSLTGELEDDTDWEISISCSPKDKTKAFTALSKALADGFIEFLSKAEATIAAKETKPEPKAQEPTNPPTHEIWRIWVGALTGDDGRSLEFIMAELTELDGKLLRNCIDHRRECLNKGKFWLYTEMNVPMDNMEEVLNEAQRWSKYFEVVCQGPSGILYHNPSGWWEPMTETRCKAVYGLRVEL